MNDTKAFNGSILIVDDVPLNIQLLSNILKEQGYEIRVANSGPAALAAVEAEPPNLILLDIQMPEMDGYQVCSQLKNLGTAKDIPIIFISALDEIFDKVTAFKIGGVDYITKPFQLEEVLARVHTHLTLRQLQLDLEQKNKQLEKLASTDPLTQVYNRRFFFDLADRELSQADRSGQPLSILLLDIDHFKKVNDTHGHLIGDQVLIQVATRITNIFRKGDIFARYGGEEFIGLMPNTAAKDAANLGERLRKIIAEKPIPTAEIPVTISLGLATWRLNDSITLTQLIDQADQALYHAKQNGRNRLITWPIQ